ncbi:MAG: SDR family oxidoreductase [Acidimicrobiales bacterium]
MKSPQVLVTGASGYVGGRVVPALLDLDCQVRCLVRTPAKLRAARWFTEVEVVEGSVDDDLSEAMAGITVAVYLVHAIGEGDDWAEREVRQAHNFASAAAAAGVQRIVYLGGLGDDRETLSKHLTSRQDVGAALVTSGVRVIELRAGVIIGSGSASFEMLRYLVDLLPIMVTPKWVSTKCQPVSIADVVTLVVKAVTSEQPIEGVLEVGGADVVTYAQMMETYCRCAGLPKRFLIPVPLLSPRLSSHWIGLVTPVPVPLAKELIQSLVNEVIVNGRSACEEFGVVPLSLEDSITRALEVTRDSGAPTRFSDADLIHFQPNELDPDWAGGTVFTDRRVATSRASARDVFGELSTIGGEKGWYGGQFLWSARGMLDQLIGGPGLRRGRRSELRVGDALDFWRIECVEPPECLRLRAEMRLPGAAWLSWTIEPIKGGSSIVQTATFRPRGFLGRLYWFSVLPFHHFVFPTMLRRLVAVAEAGH